MTSINKKIVDLLNENKSYFDSKPIAYDGIICEEKFKDTDVKVLFLLKEINDPDMTRDWKTFLEDVKGEASKEIMYPTWPNVCLWMEVFKNPQSSFMDCMKDNGTINTKKIQTHLLDIAIVNVKKTAGGGSSNYEEILEAADKYGHITLKEIELIEPKLVICGGTFDFAKQITGISKNEIKNFPTGAEYFIHNGILYLKFVHPVWYSVNRNILFNYAKNVFFDVHKKLEELKY